MPKFSIKTEVDLVEQMRVFGINEAFSKGQNLPEFSFERIFKSQNFSIEDIRLI